ncbi:MAG TPA: hypothetical protein PL029_05765 [Bacteroidia bacterium]|nr:hypothetical protein [Bacteroidia bacterium]
MTPEKQPIQKKIKGLFALIAALILLLGFIGNLKGSVKSMIVIVRLFRGSAEAYEMAYAISYLLIPLLMLYGSIKLFAYSGKNLFKSSKPEEQ